MCDGRKAIRAGSTYDNASDLEAVEKMSAVAPSQFNVVQPRCANPSIAVLQSSSGAPRTLSMLLSILHVCVVGLGGALTTSSCWRGCWWVSRVSKGWVRAPKLNSPEWALSD